MLFVWIATGILAAIAFWMAVWILTSFLVGRSERQKRFVASSAPRAAPMDFTKVQHICWATGRFRGWENRLKAVKTKASISLRLRARLC